MKQHMVGLKELREHMDSYISEVDKGKSFLVMRKSKPLFKIVPPELEEQWEMVADFTKLHSKGVDAREVLKTLRKMNA